MGEKKSKHFNLRRLNCYILYVVIFGMLAALVCKAEGGDATTSGEFKIDPATLKCLGFRWYIGGDDNGNAKVEAAYRKKGASEWKKALPYAEQLAKLAPGVSGPEYMLKQIRQNIESEKEKS